MLQIVKLWEDKASVFMEHGIIWKLDVGFWEQMVGYMITSCSVSPSTEGRVPSCASIATVQAMAGPSGVASALRAANI